MIVARQHDREDTVLRVDQLDVRAGGRGVTGAIKLPLEGRQPALIGRDVADERGVVGAGDAPISVHLRDAAIEFA